MDKVTSEEIQDRLSKAFPQRDLREKPENIGEFLYSWGVEQGMIASHQCTPQVEQGMIAYHLEKPQDVVIVSNNGVRNPCLGDMVIFVDETPDDYNSHAHKPALVQHLYAPHGFVHLHVFEDKPQDNRAVDAFYSNQHEPGTFHFIGD